jgi:hypothetical protein
MYTKTGSATKVRRMVLCKLQDITGSKLEN